METSSLMGLFADHILHLVRKRLFVATVEEKPELGGTRFINMTCILSKRLLGMSGLLQVHSKLRFSKFSQMISQMMSLISTSPHG